MFRRIFFLFGSFWLFISYKKFSSVDYYFFKGINVRMEFLLLLFVFDQNQDGSHQIIFILQIKYLKLTYLSMVLFTFKIFSPFPCFPNRCFLNPRVSKLCSLIGLLYPLTLNTKESHYIVIAKLI